MLDCIKNYECIESWILSNITWGITTAVILTIIPTIYKSFKISKFLLKQNRLTKGNGWGRHLADRFIDSWRWQKGLKSDQVFYSNPNQIPSCWWLSAIDEKLEEKKLVYLKDGKIYPIINWKNRLIIKILKFYLIHITGDSKNEYTGL